MTYSFARVGAAEMRVEDYYVQGRRTWVRLHEKGGKRHEMPAHQKLEHYLHEYIKAADIGEDEAVSAPRSAAGARSPRRRCTGSMPGMIQRRAAELGMTVKISCHTFRATGITAYLENGGTLENAQPYGRS